MPLGFRPGLALVLLLASTPGSVAAEDRAYDPLAATESQSNVYALGLLQARQLRMLQLSDGELRIFQQAVEDGWIRDPKIALDRQWDRMLVFERGRRSARAEIERRAGAVFLELAAREPGALRTASGLIYTSLEEGQGPPPAPDARVKVHFHGTLRDGVIFDSSIERKIPHNVELDRMIPCWREGLQRMKVGGHAKLVCPPQLAYGDKPPSRLIPPQSVLIFEIELLAIR